MKLSWISEIYQTTTFKLSTRAGNEVLSAITDRPTDSMLESLYKMQVERSEELKYLLQVHAQEMTFGDKKYDYCRLKLMAQRHLEKPRRGQTYSKPKITFMFHFILCESSMQISLLPAFRKFWTTTEKLVIFMIISGPGIR